MELKALQQWSKDLHILYVEDEELIRTGTTNFLKHFSENLTVASNGEEGLKYFQNGKFDIVITDLKMPKLSGEDMITKIKEISPQVVVIAMSGLSGNEGRENLASDFYLKKPTGIEEFVAVLTQIKEQGLIQ